MAVIAMTREMATLGKDVAAGLAERLGLDVVHHELVEHDIAERAGLQESEVHRFLEGEATLYERWKIDSKRLSRYTAQEILDLAVKGNVLIRGWGATYLLRSVPHVICVRICAPMPFREKVLMQRLNIKDSAVARSAIQGSDAGHNKVMQKLFAVDWMDASLYAIVLNTARVAVDDCVEHIARLAASPAYQETEQSRAALVDETLLSRVRAALEQQFGSTVAGLGSLDASVSDARITLLGATTDQRVIEQAIRLVHGVEGVKAVESRIAHLAFRPSM